MFESDDYDQILSQLDLPESCINTQTKKLDEPITSQTIFSTTSEEVTSAIRNKCSPQNLPGTVKNRFEENSIDRGIRNKPTDHLVSPIEVNNQIIQKHTKRKLINSYFDHKSKRKFPGPAGLLNGSFEDSKEDDICHVELLSQDIDYAQSYLNKGIFESPLWSRLLQDTKELNKVDTIKSIKQQAIRGNLRRRKAEVVTAFIESVDRSAIDPQIVIRDTTESIKCTLHRDAWVAFSPYLVSECCALVLYNPTVLTTGSAFKKHYLNITLNNIHAVYSSAIIERENESFPLDFKKVYEDDYTIIRNEKVNTGTTDLVDDSNLLDGLDGVFSDDIF